MGKNRLVRGIFEDRKVERKRRGSQRATWREEARVAI